MEISNELPWSLAPNTGHIAMLLSPVYIPLAQTPESIFYGYLLNHGGRLLDQSVAVSVGQTAS